MKKPLNELYRKVEIEEVAGGGKTKTRTEYMSAAVIAPIEKNEAAKEHNMARLGITKIQDGYYALKDGEYVTATFGGEETEGLTIAATEESTGKKSGRKSKAELAAAAAKTTPSGLGPDQLQTPGYIAPATEVEAANGANLPKDGLPIIPGTEPNPATV